MKAHLTGKDYSFEIETDEWLATLTANLPFTLTERLENVEGVRGVRYQEQFGPPVVVSFDVDEGGEALGLDEAGKVIAEHVRQCEAFVIYVGGDRSERRSEETGGKKLLHAGDGFVLCDAEDRDGNDLGVSLHFLEGGDRQTKWFIDGAARQFRDLAAEGDAARIQRVIAKHIDLDPARPMHR